MRRRRVKLGLYGLTVAEVIQYCRNVITSMTGNAYYPAPVPTLEALTTAVNELETAQDNASDGGKTLTAIRNEKLAAVFNLMRQLRDHVNVVGDGNEVILLSSGFALAKLPEPKTGVKTPQNVTAKTQETPGDVLVECNTLAAAELYQIRYQPMNPETPEVLDEVWDVLDPVAPKKQLVTGLKAATYYWFEMRGVGRKGPGPWSDPAKGLAA